MSIEEFIPVLQELVEELKKRPLSDGGIAYFYEAGLKTVNFNVEFEEPPSVNARFESPEGWPRDMFPFSPPGVNLDKLETIAMATIKKFDAVIDFPDPLADGKSYPVWLADKLLEAAESYLKTDSFTASLLGTLLRLTKARDNIISLTRRIGEIIGHLIEKYVFGYIKARLLDFRDQIKAKLNEILEDIRNKIKDALEDAKNKIENVLNPFRSNLQDGVNTLSRYTCDAFNLSLDKYYDTMGLQKGVLAIPAMVKQGSITCTGFEVWAYGTGTLHWHAIGFQSMIDQPIIKKIETLIELKS